MEDHKIKGNFVKKFFPDLAEDTTLVVSFPSKIAELRDLAKEGKIVVEGRDFPIDEEAICGWAYRGFSLQHQGGEILTDEQKAERKADRQDKAAILKEDAEVRALYERKLAERKAARAAGK